MSRAALSSAVPESIFDPGLAGEQKMADPSRLKAPGGKLKENGEIGDELL
jgi:hypothetical protein